MAFPDFGSTPMYGQERFVKCFDPDGDGFIYRPRPDAPGVSVTAKECAEMIAIDDDRRWIATILYILTLPLAAAVGVGLSMSPSLSPWAPAVSSSIFFGMPLATAVWVSKAPNRILRGRPYVDKGLPAVEAARRSIRETSWLELILTAAGGMAGGLYLVSSTGHSMPVRLLGALLILVPIGMLVHEVKIKLRVDAQDRRGTGE